MRLIILPAARKDLTDIGDFIALDSKSRARSFVAEIETAITKISHNAKSYPKRDDLAKELRVKVYKSYLIFFKISEKEITISRVLHSARNVKRLLDTE